MSPDTRSPQSPDPTIMECVWDQRKICGCFSEMFEATQQPSSSTKCVHPEKLMLSGGSKLTANMDLDYLLISQCILFILLTINNYISKTILKFKRFISQVLNKVGSHTHLIQKHKQQTSASSSLVFTNHLS